MRKLLIVSILLTFGLTCCGGNTTPVEGDQTMAFKITSPAFAHQESVPVQYTCDGDDISPPLQWTEPPANTQSFALIMDDPDAPVGTWDHWILFNIPAGVRELPAAAAPPAGSVEGNNSWRHTGYGGPCPPGGKHHYFFKLYALDTILNLAAGANKDDVLAAMAGHILAQTELMGTYTRQ
jgi:hypothetical protein